MGTYAQLKARVAAELMRTDQTANIVSAIARAIEHYAGKRFWFNQDSATATLDAGETYLEAPRYLDNIYVLDGATPRRLEPVRLDEMTDLQAFNPQGQLPYLYALYGAQVRVYPPPDQTYTFRSHGLFDLAPLTADADANAWTTEAQDLIASRAKYTISRDIIGNADRAAAAQLAEREALRALMAETTKRMGTGRLMPSD